MRSAGGHRGMRDNGRVTQKRWFNRRVRGVPKGVAIREPNVLLIVIAGVLAVASLATGHFVLFAGAVLIEIIFVNGRRNVQRARAQDIERRQADRSR
jgi:hypothetical protein